MVEKSKGKKKQNILLPVCLAFVVGFVAGVAFAVFKLDSSAMPDTAHQTTQQAPQPDPHQNDAILALEAKVTANPEDVDAWVQLGHLYYDSNLPKKAIGAYTKSLELHSGTANLYTDLGVMYRRDNQAEKAIESFDKAISMDPNHEFSRLNKGIVLLYDLDKPEEAFASWDEVLKINPDAKIATGQPLKEVLPQIKAELAKQQ